MVCLRTLRSCAQVNAAIGEASIVNGMQAGFKDVVHLEGGLSQWRHDGFPVDGR